MSLQTRVGLVLTAAAAILLLLAQALWLNGTRNAIHEEVEAATRVSEQWLRALATPLAAYPEAERADRLLALVQTIGRVRANRLEVRDTAGQVRYVSPPSVYKAGREAPRWFSAALVVNIPVRQLEIAGQSVSLHPDASRAVLDAWDELLAMAGWGGLLLLGLFVATRIALGRALSPLGDVMQALDNTGIGRFDTRLPVFATPELGRLSRAFNGMADRLKAAVDENVRLETDQALAQQLHGKLTAERQEIARELHDELAQGITAVRALAGAIAQQADELPAVATPARHIITVTGAMQEGVGQILHRLQPAQGQVEDVDLAGLVCRLADDWRQHHPQLGLSRVVDIPGMVPAPLAHAVLRMLQEGLTNIVRHSGASRVDLAVTLSGPAESPCLRVRLADDGRGIAEASSQAGSGLGLQGMRERLQRLGGQFWVETPLQGGFCLCAELPLAQAEERSC